MSQHTPVGEVPSGAIDRRALLRRGGSVAAAGVVAFGAAEVVSRAGAQAASGENAVLGRANSSGADPTTLTSTSRGSTLKLANTGEGPPLRLEKSPVTLDGSAFVGGELANVDGELYYTAGGPGALAFGFLYSEYTASQVVPVRPQRVLDTRTAVGRQSIVDPTGRLDAEGRLLSGRFIEIDLLNLASEAAAAFMNLTAVLPLGSGFLTVYPGGDLPVASMLNFTANQIVANSAVTGVSADDTVSIYARGTTHVILDVTAFAVGNPSFQIDPSILVRRPVGLPARARGAAATQRRQPTWRTSGTR